jgi:hypothetical protein
MHRFHHSYHFGTRPSNVSRLLLLLPNDPHLQSRKSEEASSVLSTCTDPGSMESHPCPLLPASVEARIDDALAGQAVSASCGIDGPEH